MSEQYALRFGGVERLYGAEAIKVFQQAHVCVIGIGGVGTWVAEGFARSGFGEITLIDMDDVCITNTNRQIHATTDTIGRSKIDVMAERLKTINPECKVNVIEDFVTRETVRQHITKDFNYVVDAIDGVSSKAAVVAHCKRNKIKVISIGGAGGQIDPTKVTTSDINKTHNDPLIRKLRATLRRHYGFSRTASRVYGVSCVYSTEQLRYPQADGSICQQKYFADGDVKLDCSGGFGAAVMVTATFGFVAVSKVIEKMLRAAEKKAAEGCGLN
ncbi:MAG: tRNA cyclic N6-threonylcarbamoyladenosine(37) synthase TcdA [Moraxellaceae bacterium]|nr:MAG: tRNA cyclic N6-threonylcarbamoyladenosine(37) synthase TcdA [Moraxellaceae bacterium]